MTRAYDQYCSVAAGLDLIGDRWTMLILRDLVWYGPQRFSDFAAHNEGIPPALLTERLRSLAKAGLVRKDESVYHAVDPEGQLLGVIDALAAFGNRLLATSDPTIDSLTYLARRMSAERAAGLATEPPVRFTLTIGTTSVGCLFGDGRIALGPPIVGEPEATTTRDGFLGLVSGTVAPIEVFAETPTPNVLHALTYLSPTG